MDRHQLLDLSGRPTTDTVRRYTEGDCWLLAFELGRRLNAPLVALVHPLDPSDWVHVTVDLGRETLLDVLGPRTRDETIDFWETRLQEPLVFRELGRAGCIDDLLAALEDTADGLLVTQRDEEDVQLIAASLLSHQGEDTQCRASASR